MGLVNGGPLSVDWLKHQVDEVDSPIGAVVEMFELGQSAGTAVASILFGDTSPSGS